MEDIYISDMSRIAFSAQQFCAREKKHNSK